MAQLGDLMLLQALRCPMPTEAMALEPDFKRSIECATGLMTQKAELMQGKKPGPIAACKP